MDRLLTALPTTAQAEFKQVVSSLPRLRLAVLDHISSCPPVRFDVEGMARACRSAGALVFVDGAHAGSPPSPGTDS